MQEKPTPSNRQPAIRLQHHRHCQLKKRKHKLKLKLNPPRRGMNTTALSDGTEHGMLCVRIVGADCPPRRRPRHPRDM